MAVKRITIGFILFLFLAALLHLTGCGTLEYPGDTERDADLVFVNNSRTFIGLVAVRSELEEQGTIHADETPLRAGERLDFAVGGDWPVTVTVYGDIEGRTPLAEVTVTQPPQPGERWEISASDGEGGLSLTVTAAQPEV